MGEEPITKVVFRKWPNGGILAVVVALVVLLLLPTVSVAAENLYQEALRGLKGVGVLVESMDPQAELLGLSKDQIQTDVELRLRKAGVRVLTLKEQIETPGKPYLYVNVNTSIGQGLPIVVYSGKVELMEMVTLKRGFETAGAIWETGSVGRVGTEKISQIRERVGGYVDKFINDYLAANPKK